MVLKGAAARKLKASKLLDRKDRSLYVTFKNANHVERTRIVEILESAHPNIERVFLPRHKIPKFVYVLCTTESERKSVKQALKEHKNDELGQVYPKIPKTLTPRPEPKPDSEMKCKRVMNPCVLLLEWIPKEVVTDELKTAFPEAEKLDRFNQRRCYVYFKTAKDAMQAKIRISKETVGGHRLHATFNKGKKTK